MLSVLVPIAVVLLCALVVAGSGWPTVPRKVRRMFVFSPALAWVAVAALGLGSAIVLPTHSQSPATLAAALGFAGLGFWSVAQAVKASREAMSDPLEPFFEPRPRFTPLPKQPLTDAEQELTRYWLGAFEAAELLETDEVTLSDVLDHSEHDDQCPYGLRNFLEALCSSKPRYRHLAFFFDSVEFSTEHAIHIVTEFARLASREARNVELEHVAPVREDRGQDTVIVYDLEGERHQTRFIMYAKALPWDLIDDLRNRMRPHGDERGFEIASSERLAMLTFISRVQRETLQRLVRPELFDDVL